MKSYYDNSFDDEFLIMDKIYDRDYKNRRKRIKEYLLRWKGYSSTDDNCRRLDLGFNHNLISNYIIRKKNNRKKNLAKLGALRSGHGNRSRYTARYSRKNHFTNANISVRNQRKNPTKHRQSASGSGLGNKSANTAPSHDNGNGCRFVTDANKSACDQDKNLIKDGQSKTEASGSGYGGKTTPSDNNRKNGRNFTNAKKFVRGQKKNWTKQQQSKSTVSGSGYGNKSANTAPSHNNRNGCRFVTDANKSACDQNKNLIKDGQSKTNASGLGYGGKATPFYNTRKHGRSFTDAKKSVCGQKKNSTKHHQSKSTASGSGLGNKSIYIVPSGDSHNGYFTDTRESVCGQIKGAKKSFMKTEMKRNDCGDNNSNACMSKISKKQISKSLPSIIDSLGKFNSKSLTSLTSPMSSYIDIKEC